MEDPNQTFPQETAVQPTAQELVVVQELQRRGAPQQVQFIETDAFGITFAGWTVRMIRFIASNGKKYEAESFRLMMWPQISFNEMKSQGMITQ